MWADKVDEWIISNEKKRGNPESTAFFKFYKFMFHAAFLFSTLIIWKMISSAYYHPYIRNRNGHFKIDDAVGKKAVENVLTAEATQLKEDESVLFVVTSGTSKEALVFTDNRLLFQLDGPSKMSFGKLVSGTIALSDLGRPAVDRSIADNTTVSFGSDKIGALSSFVNDTMLLDFLRQIHLEMNNHS